MTRFKRIKNSALVWLACALWVPAAGAQDKVPASAEMSSALFYEILVGELSVQSGDFPSAYQYLLDAARKSNNDGLYERSVEVALRARAGDSALQAAQAWSRALPASDQAHRYLLQILIALNKLPETVEANRRALSSRPLAARITLIDQLPGYFSRAPDKAAADKALEQSLTPEFSNTATGASAYAAIGTLRLLNDDLTGAMEAAKKGAAVDPSAEQPSRLALNLINPMQPDAEALLRKYLETGARPELRMGYVRKLLEDQRYAEASAQVDVLTHMAPEFPDAWLVRGSIELQNRNSDAARTSLQKYVALKTAATPDKPSESETDRGLVQAYFLLAQIAELNQQLELAQQYLDQINSQADALRIQSQRAAILAKQGHLEEARALIRDTPETQTDDARNKINAEAQLLRENKQYKAEYELLQSALRSAPQDADLQYDLAMSAEKVGKPDEMETLLRQVIASKPDYPHAYNALGYSLADRNIRLTEARSLITKALEFAPNDPYIADSLGWVEFRIGNLQEAEKILRDAYNNKRDAEIAAHLGEVLWALHQPSQAKEIWKEGLSLSPDNETLLETMKRLNSW
jgi:tetratricopeptide (TPR) repeat protein